MRLFVAVVPPLEVIEHLDSFLEPRREVSNAPQGSLRWSDPEHFHITLAFSEDFPDYRVDDLSTALATAAAGKPRASLQLGGGGAFPNVADGRLLYARIAEPEGWLASLSEVSRNAVTRSGGEVAGEKFKPHLTLARSNRPRELTKWVRLMDAYLGPAWQADELALVASYLGQGRRSRPRYEVLSIAPLSPDNS